MIKRLIHPNGSIEEFDTFKEIAERYGKSLNTIKGNRKFLYNGELYLIETRLNEKKRATKRYKSFTIVDAPPFAELERCVSSEKQAVFKDKRSGKYLVINKFGVYMCESDELTYYML